MCSELILWGARVPPPLPSARRGASPTPPRLVSDTPPPPGVYTAFVARRRRRRCGREEISARRPREPQPRAPLRADPPFAAATLAAAQPAAVHAPQPHPTLPSPGKSLPPRPVHGCSPPRRARRRHNQQHGEVFHLPEAGLAHLHDHHEEREEVILPLSTPPHRPHTPAHAPCTCNSPPAALLRPRSYKKFVTYLSKELKANGKAFDFTIAGAKWASQEEGHEFKFEFGEA